jgi:hypothetical protein
MRRDPRAYLWDAVQALSHVEQFTRDRTFEDYEADVLLRSGVERQLEIAGQALNQLSRLDADLAARIPELASIVGFRTDGANQREAVGGSSSSPPTRTTGWSPRSARRCDDPIPVGAGFSVANGGVEGFVVTRPTSRRDRRVRRSDRGRR